MEFVLKVGKITIDDKLYLNDGDIKSNLYLLKFLGILNGISLMINGYKSVSHDSKYIVMLFIALFIFDIIFIITVYKRSTATEIEFNTIKKIIPKKMWWQKYVLKITLKNGKHRFISQFENPDDAEDFYQFINDKINLKS